MKKNLEKAINNFKKYVQNFDFNNPKIESKFYHTFRVMDYAMNIAKSEMLNAKIIRANRFIVH